MMGGHRAFTVRFDDVLVDDPRRVLGGADGLAEPELRRVANSAVALRSLDLVGVGEAVLERTVDYTKMRQQFGRPIASFQAAQHLVANMHIALAAARLAAQSAVFWIGARPHRDQGNGRRQDACGRGQKDHPGCPPTPWRDGLRD